MRPYSTAPSRMRIVPASASTSASAPTGRVNCRSMWPIWAPCQAGTPSGPRRYTRMSSRVSDPKPLPGPQSEQVPNTTAAARSRIPARASCVIIRSTR